jgi:phage gp46-like protein
MSDLRTLYSGFVEGADLALDGDALAENEGLETAVILSLFTDRRADPGDPLPDGETDPRGWWGDIEPLAPGYRLGSRLWLLSREKQLPEVLARAKLYAEEALAWLVESGEATRVAVEASAPRRGVLWLQVEIDRARGGETQRYRMGASLVSLPPEAVPNPLPSDILTTADGTPLVGEINGVTNYLTQDD